MLVNSILNFILEQIPDLLLNRIFVLIPSYLKLLCDPISQEANQDEGLEMGDNISLNIWFDGVDKRLIEAHAKKVEMVKGNDNSLLTNRPLISYRGIVKRRKQVHENNKTGKKTSDIESTNDGSTASTSKIKTKSGSKNGLLDISKHMLEPSSRITEELALDCEMVECFGHKSVLARISIVNLFGRVILDTFVAPPAQVTDYRTRYSGIRARDLANAPSFEEVQAQVASIIKDRIVVGHAIHNDFAVLKLHHPNDKIRDTSPYFGKHYCLGKTPSLKRLCNGLLGIKIQSGEHDSVQDAQATMKLYVKAREKWNESCLKGKQASKQQKVGRQKTKPKKKKVKAFFVETLGQK